MLIPTDLSVEIVGLGGLAKVVAQEDGRLIHACS
jgi:hypothetical protein